MLRISSFTWGGTGQRETESQKGVEDAHHEEGENRSFPRARCPTAPKQKNRLQKGFSGLGNEGEYTGKKSKPQKRRQKITK